MYTDLGGADVLLGELACGSMRIGVWEGMGCV